MNREIKFRAWDDREKMWVDLSNRAISEDGKVCFVEDQFLSLDEHFPILMQFIGLKDKNGKEIYEGDIVKNHNGYTKFIEWEDGGFVVKSKTRIDFCQDCADNCEVIGNIYENPNLIK